jgi:hypothetical protein
VDTEDGDPGVGPHPHDRGMPEQVLQLAGTLRDGQEGMGKGLQSDCGRFWRGYKRLVDIPAALWYSVGVFCGDGRIFKRLHRGQGLPDSVSHVSVIGTLLGNPVRQSRFIGVL